MIPGSSSSSVSQYALEKTGVRKASFLAEHEKSTAKGRHLAQILAIRMSCPPRKASNSTGNPQP